MNGSVLEEIAGSDRFVFKSLDFNDLRNTVKDIMEVMCGECSS